MEQFRAHYDTVHAPLALKLFPLMRRHKRNYILPIKGQEEPEFDVISECWFDSWEDMKQSRASITDEIAAIIDEDEKKFLDQSSIRSFVTEEVETLPRLEQG